MGLMEAQREWRRKYKDRISNDGVITLKQRADYINVGEISAPDLMRDKRGEYET
jgi:hypothetical protein